ncbi:MAG TPA: tRNA-intron lyase [Candidatus Nanoarchaeia archaeon]|nr:tRNA-intron lyase [Candidatus Nanoarchaeia archaeon]
MANKTKKKSTEAAEPETSEEQESKKTVKEPENKVKKKEVMGILAGARVITESSDDAREFYNQSRFGTIAENGKVELSLLEALYLMERNRLIVKTESGRVIMFETYVKKARKVEPNFWTRYSIFKDMRNRGYIIKTALKFGADFRVYDRGVKPGEDHARWIVFPVNETSVFTWHEFSAKNRVAHSTKKKLLLAIVDDENDVTYYETRWMRP